MSLKKEGNCQGKHLKEVELQENSHRRCSSRQMMHYDWALVGIEHKTTKAEVGRGETIMRIAQ